MANGRIIHDDLRLEIIRVDGKYTIEFAGIWGPKDVKFAQKYITDQYRANRKKIAAEYNKSGNKFKQKHMELKVRERDLKHKENKIQNQLSPLEVMAQESSKVFNKQLGMINDSTRKQSGLGTTEQSSGANTSGTRNQEVTGVVEPKPTGSKQSDQLATGSGRTSAPSVEASRKDSAGIGTKSGTSA